MILRLQRVFRPCHITLFHRFLSAQSYRTMSRNIVYFDLETKRTANDAGGWNRKLDMGMSVGVTYSTRTGSYKIYSEKRVQELIEELMRADLVVGYNIISFDYQVLMGYTILELPEQCRTLDLMVDIEQKLGHRLGLDTISTTSLGVGKIADGLDAIKWYREGKMLQIAEYCCFDVKCTRLVHEFGVQHKRIWYTDRSQQKRFVDVDWA